MPTELQTAPRLSDFRLTLRLALPLIMAEVGWMSMGVVDTIMVGRLPDSAIAIGATGLGQSLYHVIAILWPRGPARCAQHVAEWNCAGALAHAGIDDGGFILASSDAPLRGKR